MSNLKSGLEFFINEVEKLPDDTVFNMCRYDLCVIGKTHKWVLDEWDGFIEPETLLKYFGILKIGFGLFSKYRKYVYTDEQWSVIRLFTNDIGNLSSKQKWLELAKAQLGTMK